MSRGVINCLKLFLSHPFSRIKLLNQWAVDRDPVLTLTTSAKVGKTAICAPDICHVLYNWEHRDRHFPREPSKDLAIVFWNAAETEGIGKT